MSQFDTTFPILAVSASAITVLCGLWLILRRSTRRVGVEPRCHQCDYILTGLASERCPECGTVIDPQNIARGRRRSRLIRVAVGSVLLTCAWAISWSPVKEWSNSIYWYQFRPAFLVIRDLTHGDGLPAPANNPLEPTPISGLRSKLRSFSGPSKMQVDLARVALEELLRRDKQGNLSTAYRHQMDELALSNLGAQIRTPLQADLESQLVDRLIAGKLTADEQARIYRGAVTMTLSVPPVVMLWDDLPIRIDFHTSIPVKEYGDLRVTYRSIRIDGKEVQWSKNDRLGQFECTYLYNRMDTHIDRLISCLTLGRHRVDLDLRIDVRYGSAAHPGMATTIHSEFHTLSASFLETKPTFVVKAARFLKDPTHESGHYFSVPWLKYGIASPVPAIRDSTILEMIRRDGLGELATEERDCLVNQILSIQKALSQPWNGAYGDYIEGLQAAKRLSETQWRRYGQQQLGFYLRARREIRVGDPLPVDLVTVARRGDSQVDHFSASQWTIEYGFSEDIPRPWTLDSWDGRDVFSTPHDGPDFVHRYVATFPDAPLGLHTMRAKIKPYNLTWTSRPQGMEIPSEYDLGKISFSIVPRAADTIMAVHDQTLQKQIEKCIDISNLLRWHDGSLTFSIHMHDRPVDLAFRVSVLAANHEWKVGEVFAAKGSAVDEVYSGFHIQDAREMPTSGLIFKFSADADLARQSVGANRYWDTDITIGNVSIGQDDFLNARR